jgi:hypothetical protein
MYSLRHLLRYSSKFANKWFQPIVEPGGAHFRIVWLSVWSIPAASMRLELRAVISSIDQ